MISLALIGAGHWGPFLARSFYETGSVTLRYIHDQDRQKAVKLAQRYPGAGVPDSLDQVFADETLTAVAIATPAVTHYQLTHRALDANKHVFVEKPLTLRLDEAAKLTVLAERQRRTLLVGHVFQYNEALNYVKKLLNQNELGTPYYLNFERTNLGPVRKDVNAAWDLVSHDISIMHFLLDEMPTAVTAYGRGFLDDRIEDTVFATFTFARGAMAHVHASWLNPRKVRQLTLVGSEKMLVWDDLDMRHPVSIFDKRVVNAESTGDTFVDYKTTVVDGGMHCPPLGQAAPLLLECEHFIDCVTHDRRPNSDGHSGLAVVQVLEALHKSLHGNGALVEISAPQPAKRPAHYG